MVSNDPVMQMLGFKVKTKEEEQAYSRDVIKGALHPYIDDEELEAAVSDVIRSLAAKHLHIFKSKGSEQ